MALRKAASYSKKTVVPYTRVSKVKGKAYVKTVPPRKLVKFKMGREDLLEEGKLPHFLTVVTKERVQIRDNALEACRQYLNKKLEEGLSGIYYFKVVPVPHHIQRENKMLTGAGADRMQTGMQLSFGKAVNKSAILNKNGRVFEIAVADEKGITLARHILKEVRAKLPCEIKVLYKQIKKNE